MAELAEQIIAALRAKPEQLARDLGASLNVDKKLINSALYGPLKGQVEQDSRYRWSLVGDGPALPMPEAPARQNTPLARLCRYYLACMGQDEVGVSVFAQDKYGNPDYATLEQLSASANAMLAAPDCQRLLGKVRKDRNASALFLGYPVSLRLQTSRKSSWQGYMVEPVMLFPLELNGPNQMPVLDLTYPIINHKVLQNYSNAEREGLMEELAQLEQELGLGDTGELVELDELVMRLRALREEWPWQEEIDPHDLAQIPAIPELAQPGIYNRAVLVMAQRSPYTQGLESELKQLAALSPGATDGTALGDWLKGETLATKPGTGKPLIQVLPMNLEQGHAVDSALNAPLTIVTGPPGTGKSQVVTNLLINAAWQGKRVLFASKNNKAVDVVEARINNLGPRPVLLRLGSNQYQTKLAEYLMSLMAAAVSREDHEAFAEFTEIHQKLDQRLQALLSEEQAFLALRNEVDRLEQAAEAARSKLPAVTLRQADQIKVPQMQQRLTAFESLLHGAERHRQSFLDRVFWRWVWPKRLALVVERVAVMVAVLKPLGVDIPDSPLVEADIHAWLLAVNEARQAIDFLTQFSQYRVVLNTLLDARSLEDIALERQTLSHNMAKNADRLWRAWLRVQPEKLSSQDRQMLNRYTSLLKMVIETGPEGRLSTEVYREYHGLFPKVSHLLSCWAVTSLSAKGKLPMEPGFFDLVVFDEASQCDIASALPLLYRAKRAVVIGDPRQLSHISGLMRGQDQQLLDKHGLIADYPHWAYSYNSLFDVASGIASGDSLVNLLDHHRSHADVIEFSNQQFYEGRLRVATRYDHLKRPASDEPGVSWVHVVGKVNRPAAGGAVNVAEVVAIVRELENLIVKRGYQGSVGVVSPFRAQANAIRESVNRQESLAAKLLENDFLVDTVHRFQGDERDVMFFSPVVSSGISPGALGFLKNNGNLFNVAITRARAQLIVVGDRSACGACGVDYLENFAQYAQQLLSKGAQGPQDDVKDFGPKYPVVSNPEQVSDWEHLLYEALYKTGIKPLPQYRIEKYILDFALVQGGRRLNIEVDGERYHRNWTGELCRRDQLRNQRMFELGWDVMRFWVYEIRDDLPSCIVRVKNWLNEQ
ncbi:AAA domain-containing protein [Simiduia sp. 21SJ11W-1]|uniref:AAA domain-containing protein n=1 Tax=Simiduia sp. 21SJ11W-1 TaxID=2909669 RepID=UPI0020A1F64E|nr:AAA domain-containing protein [Simiduia sp. 21SJ11W-1]UTA47451.1 AAA domain-containing protein [Simiduia sp. 21SJ11W-1]